MSETPHKFDFDAQLSPESGSEGLPAENSMQELYDQAQQPEASSPGAGPSIEDLVKEGSVVIRDEHGNPDRARFVGLTPEGSAKLVYNGQAVTRSLSELRAAVLDSAKIAEAGDVEQALGTAGVEPKPASHDSSSIRNVLG